MLCIVEKEHGSEMLLASLPFSSDLCAIVAKYLQYDRTTVNDVRRTAHAHVPRLSNRRVVTLRVVGAEYDVCDWLICRCSNYDKGCGGQSVGVLFEPLVHCSV